MEDCEDISRELSAINAQLAALAERKRKALVKLSAANSPDDQISPEGRRDALAEVLAEAIVYLGQRGLLVYKDEEPIQTSEKSPGARASKKKKGRGSAK